MSTTDSRSIQEQLFELREKMIELKEQALEQKQKEQSFQLKLDAFDLEQRAFELKQQSFEKRQNDVEQTLILKEQTFEQRQKGAEHELLVKGQALELQQREANLEMSLKVEQHTTNMKNDKSIVEQERRSLEQEKVRLLELQHHLETILQQQVTGPNSIELFHMDTIQQLDQASDCSTTTTTTTTVLPTTVPTTPTAMSAEILSTLTFRHRQLKEMSKLIERRYDDVTRIEYSKQQELLNIEVLRNEMEIERKNAQAKRIDFENEQTALNEKIKSGQFDLLPDDMFTGLIKYAISIPPERLTLIKALQLNDTNTKIVLAMKDDGFRSKDFQDRVIACQVLKLDHVEVNRIIPLSHDEWVNDWQYTEHIIDLNPHMNPNRKKILAIIKTCRENSKRSAKTGDYLQAEYVCTQVGKQLHARYFHLSTLIDVLYSRRGGNVNQSTNTADTVFNHLWESDFTSGIIPKFTPNLKLFFSVAHIANGEWVQFHGPGTELFEIDPKFVLYVSSLCDPTKKESFRSKNIHFDMTKDTAYTSESPYHIAIKWEEEPAALTTPLTTKP